MTQKTDKAMNRRNMMLVAGGAVAGAGALIAAPLRDEIVSGVRQVVTGTGTGRATLSLANAGYDEWQAQVGAVFTLGGGTKLTLVGVRALPSGGTRPQGTRAQGFAAFFQAPVRQSVAPDLIYTATHPQYGPLPIYLEGVTDARTPGRLVAVFG